MSTLDKSIAQRFAELREGYLPAVMGLLEQVVGQTTPKGSGLSAMCA